MDKTARRAFTRTSTSLNKSVGHFARPRGKDLLSRTDRFFEWQLSRRDDGVWPYSRMLHGGPGPEAAVTNEAGLTVSGVNFASQDYLSLSGHPGVQEAAIDAIKTFGPHSAGSPNLVGNTSLSVALEKQLATTFQTEHVVLFPTGWGAGFSVVHGLVRENDYVLLDQLAHACLQRGAFAATANVVLYRHRDCEDIRRHLQEIRTKDSENGILVVTEGLFSMDSDSPDIAAIQETCREFDATLVVDVAHDFGAMGPNGTGELGTQNCLGKVDLVMGSFSKTFASNGGFICTHRESVRQFLKWNGSPHVFSNALSPVQAAVVSKCLSIVKSDEGAKLRERLMSNICMLRDGLADRGNQCMGTPSPIVPVPVGSEAKARIASGYVQDHRLLANLVEYPGVAVGSARFRLQVMAAHTTDHVRQAVNIISDSIDYAAKALEA